RNRLTLAGARRERVGESRSLGMERPGRKSRHCTPGPESEERPSMGGEAQGAYPKPSWLRGCGPTARPPDPRCGTQGWRGELIRKSCQRQGLISKMNNALVPRVLPGNVFSWRLLPPCRPNEAGASRSQTFPGRTLGTRLGRHSI